MISFIFIFSLSLVSYEPEQLEKIFQTTVMAPLAKEQCKFDYAKYHDIYEKTLCLLHAHILSESESDPWRTLYTLWYTDLRTKCHIIAKLPLQTSDDKFKRLDERLDASSKKILQEKNKAIDEIIYYINTQDKPYLISVDAQAKNLYSHFLLWSLLEQQSVCDRYKSSYMQKLLVLLHQIPQPLRHVPSIKNYIDFGFHCATQDSEEESSSWYASTDSE